MVFDCVMKCPHIGYQKCIAILRVTQLRNHMSIELIFVNDKLTSFLEICQHSHIKSPPQVVCWLQSLHSTPFPGGDVSLEGTSLESSAVVLALRPGHHSTAHSP